jgi:hypothetical protein
MKLKATTTKGRARTYATIFRERGWHVVPTRQVRLPNGGVGISTAHHSRSRADDMTFSQWFGPQGVYRNASYIGVFTGQVSGGLHVFEVNLNDPKAVAMWEKVVAWLGLAVDREFATRTKDDHLRTFIKFSGPNYPPRGHVYPGLTIFGDGDFVSIPVRILDDIKREEGVH